MQNTYPHPEWKRLFQKVSEVLQEGNHENIFTYKELNEMAGIDIKSPRGRQQFERFNKECRSILSIHWENERNVGYRIVEAYEHAKCAVKRAKKAKKQMRKGKYILEATQLEKLTEEQKKINLTMISIFGAINQQLEIQSKGLSKIAAAIESPKMIDHKVIESTLEIFDRKEKH
jgi:hypothetical protein